MEKAIIRESAVYKKLKENILPLSAMACLAPLNLIYVALNNSERGAKSLVISLDNSIPFVKAFIIPYIIWYGFIFLTMLYLCCKDRDIYYKTLTSYALGLIASYITFYFFQTTVPRPELLEGDILTRMVNSIYSADQPYNCFPSIHVLTSFLMVKGIMASNVRNKVNMSLIWITSFMIIISTVFIKQHVVFDVIGGIVYADVIFRVVELYGGRVFSWIKKQFLSLMMKKKLEI
ncbi:phosphatase PAP2 family protein [Clostridium swellfunianum]|uniref:phosphatase PAP2 family protein n=1 Tax=Clostridium swellfunianum TaxID=1367462 RepID=UPI00202FBB4A|nr:phosphatase PAP2 family protein [Clostridium swellfunianum]